MATITTPDRFLTSEPISPGRYTQIVEEFRRDPSIGGVVGFTGLVRADETDRGRVTEIEFTAHEEMAESAIAALTTRFGDGEGDVRRIHLEHALGRVPVGGIPILIVVGAGHRRAAFTACAGILEALKAEVPIYGKELTDQDGSRWKENR